MKVAIVCPYAWDRFGGVQTHVASLARSLRARGYDATIIAPQASIGDPTSENGVRIVGRAVPIPANGSMAPVSFGPVAGQGVRAALDELEPDVVHLHEPLIPSLSMLALRHPTAPTVGTFHASAESSFGYRAATPWLERTVRRLTVRTVVSEAARVLISRYFPGDYLVTPNGVEVARFQDAGSLEVGSPPRVLFFGRIEPRKGLEVLIEAMTFLRDLRPTLVVVGSGPGARTAAARARRLGIDARWLGRITDADKARAFRSCEVYCAPGLGGESFGIVLLEAMAAGAPVVCSDLPAFGAVAGDAALLVPPDEPQLLAEALRTVVTERAVADGLRAAGRLVAARFDWSQLAVEVEHAYELALGRS